MVGGSRFPVVLAEKLEELERVLGRFWYRLRHLRSLDAELRRVTHRKPFLLLSFPMWDAILSERDLLKIELASWTRGLYLPGSGAFLRQMQAADLRALALKWQGEDLNPWRQETFDRLFPGARGWPRPAQVDALCSRVAERFEPLLADRNERLAHRFEHPEAASSKELDLDDVGKDIAYCQQLLGDLRCLSSNTRAPYVDALLEADKPQAQARDMVDLLVCGAISWIVDVGVDLIHWSGQRPSYDRWRDEFYERMHQAHDAYGDPKSLFNDLRFRPGLA